MNRFDIKGKKAIVTGGTRGLGHGMAEGLLEEGCEVVIVGSSEGVHRVAEEFRSRGFACHGVQADLGDVEQRERAFWIFWSMPTASSGVISRRISHSPTGMTSSASI